MKIKILKVRAKPKKIKQKWFLSDIRSYNIICEDELTVSEIWQKEAERLKEQNETKN